MAQDQDIKDTKEAGERGLSIKLLKASEVATFLGKTEAGLEKWRILDKGPPVTKIGHFVRYRQDSLEQWIREQEQEQGA